MNEKEFNRLIHAYLEGTASPWEAKTVEKFFDSYRSGSAEWPYAVMGDKEVSKERILNLIQAHREEKSSQPVIIGRRIWVKRSLQIAATILLLFGGYALYIYVN